MMNPELILFLTDQDSSAQFDNKLRGFTQKRRGKAKGWLVTGSGGLDEERRELDRLLKTLNSDLVLSGPLPPEMQVLIEAVEKRPTALLEAEDVPDKKRDFEPFVPIEGPQGPSPQERHRFINDYGGPYATKMELNRTAVERFIQLSSLEGSITLSSLPHSRFHGYLEVNPDATVSAKRGLTINQKNLEEEENPYYRVMATGAGWAVQINGQRILKEINDNPSKESSGVDRFSEEFNKLLRHALFECVTKEKLTSAKDVFFSDKLFTTICQPVIAAIFSSVSHHGSIQEFIFDFAFRVFVVVPMAYGLVDLMKRKTNPAYLETNPRQGIEVFLPPVRVEDVIIGKGYLDFKGRTLVRPRGKKE